MLSMNIERTDDIIMNVINIGITLYFTAFAIIRHSHLKNPLWAIPSTITIMPAIKSIVAQLMPEVASEAVPV